MDTILKSYEAIAGVDFFADPYEGINVLITTFYAIISDGGTIQKVFDSTDIIQKEY